MNCDRIARSYRFLEYLTFGRALERRRFEYLDHISGARHALILGDGDGRFTAAFLDRNQSASVDSIELSTRMLDLAARRAGDRRRLNLCRADARTVPLHGPYDLVATHFFLDCLTDVEVRDLVPRVSEAMSPGARWVVSEFNVPPRGPRRWFARAIVAGLYAAFRLTTGLDVRRLPDHGAVFLSNGFRKLYSRSAVGGLLVSELWQRVSSESSGSSGSCSPSAGTAPGCTAS